MRTHKSVQIDDVGSVKIHRRKGAKNLRVRVDNTGLVYLTMPWWVPKSQGVSFLIKQKDWIASQKANSSHKIENGKFVGKAFSLNIVPWDKKTVRSKLMDGTLEISIPEGMSMNDAKVENHIKKALTRRCESIILPRLDFLAKKHSFGYKNAQVKLLKSRWGSCNQDKDITINSYLVQLPDDLVDYVIIHELMHTKHMNHSENFWRDMQTILPHTKELKRSIKHYRPHIMSV